MSDCPSLPNGHLVQRLLQGEKQDAEQRLSLVLVLEDVYPIGPSFFLRYHSPRPKQPRGHFEEVGALSAEGFLLKHDHWPITLDSFAGSDHGRVLSALDVQLN